MANVSRPSGAWPVGTLTGAAYNEQGRLYAFDASGSVSLAIGDIVSLGSTSDTNGVPYVTKLATTVNNAVNGTPLGVVVGIRPADPGVSLQGTSIDLGQTYLPAGSLNPRYCYVVDDPNIIVQIQADASTGTAGTDIGKLGGVTVTTNQTGLSQSSPYSSTVLQAPVASSGNYSQSYPFLIIGFTQSSDNTPGVNAKVLCSWNTHQFKLQTGKAAT